MNCPKETKTDGRLGSPGCPHGKGAEGCSHPSNELGICANGLCPVEVEVTEAGRELLAGQHPRLASGWVTIDQELVNEIHRNAVEKGFWEANKDLGCKLALIHSEVSEVLEELRKQEPDPAAIAEELADICIRTFDLGTWLGIDVLTAIHDKVAKNAGRPPLHGKRF